MVTKREIRKALELKEREKLNTIYKVMAEHRTKLANERYQELLKKDVAFHAITNLIKPIFEALQKIDSETLKNTHTYRNINLLAVGYESSFEDWEQRIIDRLKKENDAFLNEQEKYCRNIEAEYKKLYTYLTQHTPKQTLKMLTDNGIKIVIDDMPAQLPDVIRVNKDLI